MFAEFVQKVGLVLVLHNASEALYSVITLYLRFGYSHLWLFDCYTLRVPKGQGRYSTGLANMMLNIRCSHSLP